MKRNSLTPTILILLGGLLLLVVAAAVDYALYRLQLHVNSTFEFGNVYLLTPGISALLVAALSLAVVWLALKVSRAQRPAGALLLLLGLSAAFAPLLFFVWLQWAPLPGRVLMGDNLRLAGAFLAVLGGVLIVKPASTRS